MRAPDGWVTDTSGSWGSVGFFFPKEKSSISVNVDANVGMDLQSYVAAFKATYPDQVILSENDAVSADGTPGLEIEYTDVLSGGVQEHGVDVFFVKYDTGYVVEGSAVTDYWSANSSVIRASLASFRILPR